MTGPSPLFTPFRLGPLMLANRFVMPAMQRGMCEAGAPKPELAAYYARRAAGGVPLIIGESAAIDHPSSTVQPTSAHINAKTASAWQGCVDAVRREGGEMLLQLWHEGALRTDGQALSPSGKASPKKDSGRAMTRAEMEEIGEGFVRSAMVAQDIGAAGVEVHAAHGYLLDQFLWHGSNVRDDGYGGPAIADRARFPAEIVRAIRAECGPDFVISLRFSQWKEVDYDARVAADCAELETLATMLREAGVDVLHCSTRRFWEPEWDGDGRNLAGWVKTLGGLPTITVGSVGLDTDVMTVFMEGRDPGARVGEAIEDLETRLAAGEFDLVAVGRALIGDPDFVKKIEARDYAAIRTFTRADLGKLEWDTSIVEEAHAG
ncbi:12-oxophytodienoate reductase [Altererythrobacter salegens]|uniref:12-oxophytodienoate reductase n=1 Tax=Croceibacterium salegens TaxID=1737568 RepID=A0A6I4SYG6_9SPHN|nr:12-oxophytodienoate reductase [Croceibacterium salegens]MXO61041.1 12-oxophytodienoate reductase [Croceibacterium salegens]